MSLIVTNGSTAPLPSQFGCAGGAGGVRPDGETGIRGNEGGLSWLLAPEAFDVAVEEPVGAAPFVVVAFVVEVVVWLAEAVVLGAGLVAAPGEVVSPEVSVAE